MHELQLKLYFLILIILSFLCCKKESIEVEKNVISRTTMDTCQLDTCQLECGSTEELLFNFGFENVELTQIEDKAYISGIDLAYSDHNNWTDWRDNNFQKGKIRISYQDGVISERIAEIVNDPKNANNKVLHYNIMSPNVYQGGIPYKARIQMELHKTKCAKEYYQTCKIFFPKANMEHLQKYEKKISWLSIFEFWNDVSWTDKSTPFRVTVGLYKERGLNENFIFKVKADKSISEGKYEALWSEKAYDIPIPFGVWLNIELYIKEGNEDEGRIYLAVLPENSNSKKVVFDLTKLTQHPTEECPDGYTHIQPLKWYTSDEVVNHMKSGGYGLEIYWDDWAVSLNKQPY